MSLASNPSVSCAAGSLRTTLLMHEHSIDLIGVTVSNITWTERSFVLGAFIIYFYRNSTLSRIVLVDYVYLHFND